MNKTRLLMLLGPGLMVALGLFVLAGSRTHAQAAAGPCNPESPEIDASELEFHGLLNQWRAANLGQPPMELSGPMNRAAQWFAEATLAGNASGHLDTYGRDWQQRLLDCGYPPSSALGSGESLGVGASASAALASMATPDGRHQSGIEAPVDWTCVGIGRASSIWVVVVLKSSPSHPDCPEPGPGTPPPTTSTSTGTATPTNTLTPSPTPTPSPVANYGASIEICPGWNLVTVPVSGPIDDVFDTAEAKVSAIYRPNGEAWQRWAPGVPAYARNLSHAFAGDVLWIYGTTGGCAEVPL